MKKKLLRNAGLVALSAVLVGSTAVAFTACGPGADEYTLDVYIFCGAADEATNSAICNSWAEEYSATHSEELGGNQITVNFESNSDSASYFTELETMIRNGDYADVIYLSPKNVISYAQRGNVLDLTSYIEADETLIAQLESIWSKSLAFYATTGTQNVTDIAFDEESGHFVDTSTDEQAHVFGLPKDYSNFTLGYNRNYFTDEMKAAYTTLKASTARNVSTRLLDATQSTGYAAGITHTGGSNTADAITYATTGTYTNPYTGETIEAVEGEEAPFVAIGVPITYKPFNYYLYTNYNDALLAGDPIATSTFYYTNDEGYTIVIPGFPGETFEISLDTKNAYNEDAAYDAGTGHIVLTWTEYSALNWACTYMLNSYAWSVKNPATGRAMVREHDDTYSSWLNGPGGYFTGAGSNDNNDTELNDYYNCYGGEQYEQASFGANAYVNPWLYSNDASFIDQTNTKSLNESKGGTAIASKDSGSWAWTSATNENDITSYIGNAYEEMEKTNLDGTTRMAHNQYGMNSENFVEAYAAFQEYCATWNAHVGQTGDVVNSSSDKSFNGQNTFIVGASMFYGVGTWDVSEYQEVYNDTLDVAIAPTAVSNRLSLYVETRDAYYNDEKAVYSNGATKQTGDAVNDEYAQRANVAEGCRIYTSDEIEANQLLRQDKWGGRMDSVGYAVNAHVADAGEPEWKAAAAVSLVLALTVDKDAQVTLTYGGAQIPNVVSQCSEYLNYNTTATDGAFADMITPEGDAEGNDVWDDYYALALEMAQAAADRSTQTVAEFLNGRQINGEDVKYDTQYADVQLVNFTPGAVSTTYIAYSMRVLHMINYTRTERDLSIRMQYMNSARQQSLYTPGESWITALNATTTPSAFLAYRNQAALGDMSEVINFIAHNPAEANDETKTIRTPALYCVQTVLTSQTSLDNGQ